MQGAVVRRQVFSAPGVLQGIVRSLRRNPVRPVALVLLVTIAGVMLVPFLWLLSSSLKSEGQIWVFPIQWVPKPVMWSNYVRALTYLPFGLYTMNTLFITIMTLLGVVLTSSLAGYAFARLRFPGREMIFYIVLSTMMLPYVVTLIPTYIIFKDLGWIDTFKPLIVPAFFGGGAFNIFLFRQFFRTIPQELLDAARIDGASELKIFGEIMVPLSSPVMATVAIFTFMGAWNDFLGPLIYLNSPNKLTVALGLANFKNLYSTNWNLLMAASAAMIMPIVALFFVAQRYFVKGIVLTGMKG